MDAIGDTLETLVAVIPDLNVYRFPQDTPTPPCLDYYAGNPSQTGAGFGVASKEIFVTIRARVSFDDPESACRLLYRFLDPVDSASVEAALANANVAAVLQEGVSGPTQYSDDAGTVVRMLGADWRVEAYL